MLKENLVIWEFISGALFTLLFSYFISKCIKCIINKYEQFPAPRGIDKTVWQGAFNTSKDSQSINTVFGLVEAIFYFIAFSLQKVELIVAWLAFKVASKWQVWNTIMKIPEAINNVDQMEYISAKNSVASHTLQRWFLGTLANVLAGFFGVLAVSMIGLGFQSENAAVHLFVQFFINFLSNFILLIFNKWIELSLAFFTAMMFLATRNSAKATQQIAEDTKKSRRPYLVFKKALRDSKNYIYKNGATDRVVFPYILKNKGNAGAINIVKNHIVIRIKENTRDLIEYYAEGKNYIFSVVPGDVSITHMDDIILKEPINDVTEFWVEFYIDYKSDIPNDDRQFTSVTKFILKPIALNDGKYIFDQDIITIPLKNERISQPFESKSDIIKLYKCNDCC